MRRPAIVIVTFKRQELLAQLFESIKKLTVPAWRVVVVDNENSPRTAQMAASFAAELDAVWGPTTDDPDAEGGTSRLEYDACYGYLASKAGKVYYVPDYVLSRRREVANKEVGRVRQLNSTSDMTRYYITRNRAYLARYYRLYGDYNPVGYAVGTLANFSKELIRIMLVDREHLGSGWARLWAGYKESRRILHDPAWEPMPPLE